MRNGKQDETGTLEEMWAASERRDRERRRRENRALWYEFHMRLSEAHARLSAEHEESALALLEDERDGEERQMRGKKAAYGRPESGLRQGCQNGTKPLREGGATT